MPRLLAKRKDNVDAFFFHMPGYDDVPCPHRKSAAGGGDDGAGKERKAVNLVTFAGWKSLDDDELPEDEQLRSVLIGFFSISHHRIIA
jgi:hypothetical protein